MTAIYLIRHGQASFGQENYDCLSELGEQQAKLLGQHLASRLPKFDKVIRGSMLRHRQTAEGCLSVWDPAIPNATINADARWNEYDHQNILAQLNPEFATAAGVTNYVSSQSNPQKALNHIISAAFERWLCGEHDNEYLESWSHYQHRIEQALKELIEQIGGAKHIAVFSSGGPIAVITMQLLNIPPSNLMKVNWNLVNCGITKLICGKRGVTLSTMNEHTVFEGSNRHFITYR